MAILRDTAVTAKVEVKTGWTLVKFLHIYNPNPDDAYFQIYDEDSDDVTVGTTVPELSIWVPANGSYDSDSEWTKILHKGFTIAATTAVDNGTLVSTGLVVNAEYQ